MQEFAGIYGMIQDKQDLINVFHQAGKIKKPVLKILRVLAKAGENLEKSLCKI